MSTIERFHCTTCPSECLLDVEVEQTSRGRAAIAGSGNRCPRGDAFARQEIVCPLRILTTTVPVLGSDIELLPVRTSGAIPRALHREAMSMLRRTRAVAPVRMGDVIIADLLGTGIGVITSIDAEARER